MKYGLKTVLRSPLKTGLFFLLITMITTFLSLGAGMWRSAENMLDEADVAFMTAGEFVYTAGLYPHTELYDTDLASLRARFDLSLYAQEEVLLLEESVTQRGYIPGYRPQGKSMPFRDYAIITIKTGDATANGSQLKSRVKQTHYVNGAMVEGETVLVNFYPDGDVLLQSGREYVVFGTFYKRGGSNVKSFEILSFTEDFNIPAEYGYYSPLMEVTNRDPDEFWQSEAGDYFAKVIETLQYVNQSVDLTVSGNIQAVSAFHRGDYTLAEGYFPTSHDTNACIIPQRIASQMALSVGDTLSIAVHYPTVQGGIYNSYWPDTGFAATEGFIITGIYQAEEHSTPIYIADANQNWISASVNDYILARVVVDNRMAGAYADKIKDHLPPGVLFDLQNQGYEAATRAIYNMRETALLVMGICAAAGLAVLWFFAYLLVYRNGDSVKILLRLGTETSKTLLFLLTGSGLISLTAAVFGSVTGYMVSGRIISAVYAASEANPIYDYRFSVLDYGAQSEAYAPVPEMTAAVYGWMAAVVWMVAMFLCVLFGMRVIRSQNVHYRYRRLQRQSMLQAKQVHAQAGGARFYDALPGTSFRYTLKSAFRGGWRSLAVPILFAVLLLFLSLFSLTQDSYRRQLDSVYDDIPVTMWFTNHKGNMRDHLHIADSQLEDITATGFTAENWYANNFRYRFLGRTVYADGRICEEPLEPFVIPTGEFTYETFVSQLDMLSRPLIITNDFTKTTDFASLSEPLITWKEGVSREAYEQSYLMGEGGEPDNESIGYGLVSRDFLTEHALMLGDTIMVAMIYINNGQYSDISVEFIIAGVYTSEVNRGTVFLPENAVIITEKSRSGAIGKYYSAAGFTLSQTERLSEFKNWLATQYDRVGVTGVYRRWLVIDDKALYNTIESLTRHIGYMDLMYPVMLAAVAAIGFIVSNLLLKSRSGEITILRSLGTGNIKLFCSFFLEPVLLSIPGMLVGLGLSFLMAGGINADGIHTLIWTNLPPLALFYYLGAAVAVMHTCRRAIMQSLIPDA